MLDSVGLIFNQEIKQRIRPFITYTRMHTSNIRDFVRKKISCVFPRIPRHLLNSAPIIMPSICFKKATYTSMLEFIIRFVCCPSNSYFHLWMLHEFLCHTTENRSFVPVLTAD